LSAALNAVARKGAGFGNKTRLSDSDDDNSSDDDDDDDENGGSGSGDESNDDDNRRRAVARARAAARDEGGDDNDEDDDDGGSGDVDGDDEGEERRRRRRQRSARDDSGNEAGGDDDGGDDERRGAATAGGRAGRGGARRGGRGGRGAGRGGARGRGRRPALHVRASERSASGSDDDATVAAVANESDNVNVDVDGMDVSGTAAGDADDGVGGGADRAFAGAKKASSKKQQRSLVEGLVSGDGKKQSASKRVAVSARGGPGASVMSQQGIQAAAAAALAAVGMSRAAGDEDAVTAPAAAVAAATAAAASATVASATAAAGAAPTAVDESADDEGAEEDEGASWVVRCPCGRQDSTGFMIQCELCAVWQHGDCVGVAGGSDVEHYFCESCTPYLAVTSGMRANDYTMIAQNETDVDHQNAVVAVLAGAAALGTVAPPTAVPHSELEARKVNEFHWGLFSRRSVAKGVRVAEFTGMVVPKAVRVPRAARGACALAGAPDARARARARVCRRPTCTTT
jgi:hypothetical protein